ncbi:Protein of unknown function [Cohnella sp. OV330]|uniref:DUF4127 family protein n=1 Tax=Cohnella sp. OV330 TaxID=1855288 RepID=UPI0008E77BBC|nr:DUF4127 family protein [Cohnella sp. OV330]SFB59490.1 Protein of unknown function [Cohnella sp. OV330]
MTNVLYLPLDERPCNYGYPLALAEMTDLSVTAPPPALLGRKKTPGDVPAIARWIADQATHADQAIISVDMLVYGGIVPSRLHHLSLDTCLARLDTLRELKRAKPGLRLYAFNLITRAPAYSSSEEEPDYYADYGSELCRIGKLTDMLDRDATPAAGFHSTRPDSTPVSSAENELYKELANLRAAVPAEVQDDFLNRRGINHAVNVRTIELAAEGIIDFLIIPLDDNAEYGYTSVDQRRIAALVDRLSLAAKVHVYPGADEIGCTLFARLFCETKSYTPLFRIRYSSTRGPLCIPKYEDRSLAESIKSHLTAARAIIADSAEPADVYLMVHSPAVSGPEAAETMDPPERRHRTYASEVHIREFAEAIRHHLSRGRLVALADVALSNGGDHALMRLLSQEGLLKGIAAYAAWNTSGNALGTVISHAIIASYYRDRPEESDEARRDRSRLYYAYRLLEDWGYQSVVREDVCREELPGLDAEYFRISHVQPEIEASIVRRLEQFSKAYLPFFGSLSVGELTLPWNRMFEVGFRVERTSEKGAV